MARLRSREAETEDVNPRRLQRGAVKRTHLSRWAVGRDELAPGIVGDIHLDPSVHETIREVAAGTGEGQLLLLSATGDSFASGGDYVTTDTIEYQHGFAGVTAAGDSILWPTDAVGTIQVEFTWDTYTGGGTVEVEVDGTVPDWGLIGSGASGQTGCKRRGVHISEGAAVKIKVTQSSGSAQTGDVTLEFAILDPAHDPTLTTPAEPVVPPGEITDGFLRDGDGLVHLRLTETGNKVWQVTDGSAADFIVGSATGVAWLPSDVTPPSPRNMAVAHLAAGFSDGTIYGEADPIQESNSPAFRNGVVFRYVDDDNFWGFFNYRKFDGTCGYILQSIIAGAVDYDSGLLTTGGRGTGSPIPLEVVLNGTSIIASYDGVERVNITSSTHLAATEHGVCSFGYGVHYFSAVP